MTRVHAMTPWNDTVTSDSCNSGHSENYEKRHFWVRAWNFLQNGIQNFVIWFIHSWEIALQSQNIVIICKKIQKRLWHLRVNTSMNMTPWSLPTHYENYEKMSFDILVKQLEISYKRYTRLSSLVDLVLTLPAHDVRTTTLYGRWNDVKMTS